MMMTIICCDQYYYYTYYSFLGLLMLLCQRRLPNGERPHQNPAIITRTLRPLSPELLGKTQVATSCHLCFSPACTPCYHPRIQKDDRSDQDDTDPGQRPPGVHEETTRRPARDHQETTMTLPKYFPPSSGAFTQHLECPASSTGWIQT